MNDGYCIMPRVVNTFLLIFKFQLDFPLWYNSKNGFGEEFQVFSCIVHISPLSVWSSKKQGRLLNLFCTKKPFQSVSDLLANVEIHYPKMDFYLTVFQSFLHRNSSGIWHPKRGWDENVDQMKIFEDLKKSTVYKSVMRIG